jgi:hypothetical protein
VFEADIRDDGSASPALAGVSAQCPAPTAIAQSKKRLNVAVVIGFDDWLQAYPHALLATRLARCSVSRQFTRDGRSDDPQPAQQLHDVFVVVANDCLGPNDLASLDELQPGDRRRSLPSAAGAAPGMPMALRIPGPYSASAADADWVASVWLERQDLLDARVVLPAIGEVVLV